MKRLDEMLNLLRPPPRTPTMNMRGSYEAAARKQQWTCVSSNDSHSEWHKVDPVLGKKRLVIENGDRIRISIDGITWKDFGQTARKRFLLMGQR